MGMQKSWWLLGLAGIAALLLVNPERRLAAIRWAKSDPKMTKVHPTPPPGVVAKTQPASGPFSQIKCPTASTAQLAKNNRLPGAEFQTKYESRASSCDGAGLWAYYSKEQHNQILHRLAKTIGVKKGDVVFDWGAGCGHKLMLLNADYGALGLGVDFTPSAVRYAQKEAENNTAIKFCEGDGTKLEWIPTNSADHVITYGAMYHLPEDLQCSTMLQILRIMKPGGVFANGYANALDSPKKLWIECFNKHLSPQEYTWTFRQNWKYTGLEVYAKENFAILIHHAPNSNLPDFTSEPLEHS